MTDLGKLYDRLTPQERLSLWMAAESRGDRQDADRLLESCPKHVYTCRDFAFTERASGLRTVTVVVLGELSAALEVLGAVLVTQAVTNTLTSAGIDLGMAAFDDGFANGFANGFAAANGVKAPKSTLRQAAARRLARADSDTDNSRWFVECGVAAAASRVRSVLAAFDGWAADVFGLSGADLLTAWGMAYMLERIAYDPAELEGEVIGPMHELAAARAVAEAEPDTETVAKWRTGFDELWAQALERVG